MEKKFYLIYDKNSIIYYGFDNQSLRKLENENFKCLEFLDFNQIKNIDLNFINEEIAVKLIILKLEFEIGFNYFFKNIEKKEKNISIEEFREELVKFFKEFNDNEIKFYKSYLNMLNFLNSIFEEKNIILNSLNIEISRSKNVLNLHNQIRQNYHLSNEEFLKNVGKILYV